MSPIELWVGPEPTINRVGDRWFDQGVATGFVHRLDDIDRLASLGATRVRFPLLWERCFDGAGRFDWSWSDARLERAQACGLRIVAGLVHHGSGPPGTHLLDPAFASKLADFAHAAARRYPWIDAWTPINEPVTTARFSALYGLWYPHATSDAAFVRALWHQVEAIAASMRAIRTEIPGAQLIQTEDLGVTTGTREMTAQIAFDNARRWLGFDWLCGRVGPSHAMWPYLCTSGLDERALDALGRHPCVPDVLGLNVYVTSERFLDHRIERYPTATHGGNGRIAYADVETVRVHGAGIGGFEARLREAGRRYGLPVAITEAHLACTREEQMRWLFEAWRGAHRARRAGVDVRAVTAWAAFGAVDWHCLLTRCEGRYESGLWDVRTPDGVPRETALAQLARTMARGERPKHPVLASPGWWHRDIRIEHPLHQRLRARAVRGRPVLVVGAHGTLGRSFARLCEVRGLAHRLLSRDDLDIASPASIDAAIARWRPWAIVNAAGYVRVDDAERDPRVWRDNTHAVVCLARACARQHVRLLTFSSDLVFDGAKRTPYVETDAPHPLSVYGRSKHAGERAALEDADTALVVRTAAFFGPWDQHNFVTRGLASLRAGHAWRAADDRIITPTYVPDLVHASLDLLIDGARGLVHLTHPDALAWVDLARRAARCAGLDAALVAGVPGALLGETAPRPAYAALGSTRVAVMPPLDDALERYVHAVEQTM